MFWRGYKGLKGQTTTGLEPVQTVTKSGDQITYIRKQFNPDGSEGTPIESKFQTKALMLENIDKYISGLNGNRQNHTDRIANAQVEIDAIDTELSDITELRKDVDLL